MCKNPNCKYVHPNSSASSAPSNQFKWVSNSSSKTALISAVGQPSSSDGAENGGPQSDQSQQLAVTVNQIPAEVQ